MLVRDLEAARFAADRAFRQYDATDPANRLVAAELEARWNAALAGVAGIEAKIAEHDATAPPCEALSPASFASLADDLKDLWAAPTTDARLKKRIVRTVIREVVANIDEDASEIVLTVHWAGGVHTERPPAEAASRATQQHRARHHRCRPPAGPHRRRRSDRGPSEPQRGWSPATAIAGHGSG